jgi:hypothetical protein
MKLLFQDKGRGYFGRSVGNTFITMHGPFLGWNWPWSKFYLFDDKIILRIWPRIFELPFNNITAVKVQKFSDLTGSLKFSHTVQGYPKTFLFYSWNNDKITTLLKEKGLKIEHGSRDGTH